MPIAVVTGSASGIGRATAIQFAQAGYSVVLHTRSNLAGLQRTAASIAKLSIPHVGTRCVSGDIRCPRVCRDLVQTAFAWQDGVDVWVNNAGADVLTGAASQLSFDEKLELLLDVDVRGTIRLSRFAAQRMLVTAKRGDISSGDSSSDEDSRALPSIINIGWDQAELGMEGTPGELFCTTKSAVMAFSRAFAMSVAPAIRVNCVAPGWIQTSWGASAASPYWDQRARNEALLERWGTPEEVASTIFWLASEHAAFVNGQCLPVNGGRRFLGH